MHGSFLRSNFIFYSTAHSTQVTSKTGCSLQPVLFALWVDLSAQTEQIQEQLETLNYFHCSFTQAASLNVMIQRSLFRKHWPSRNVLWLMLPLFCPWEREKHILHNLTGEHSHHGVQSLCGELKVFQPGSMFVMLTYGLLYVTYLVWPQHMLLCTCCMGATVDTVILYPSELSHLPPPPPPPPDFVTIILLLTFSVSILSQYLSIPVSALCLHLSFSICLCLSVSSSLAIGSYGDRSLVRFVLLLW